MTEEFDALVACGVVVSSPFANKVSFFLCWKLCALGRTYTPTMALYEWPYNNIGGPSYDLEPCIGWAWLASWEDLLFKLTNWAFNDSSSFCRIWIWAAWACSTSLLLALCFFCLSFFLELPLVGKAWVQGWGALAFGYGATKAASRFVVVIEVAFVLGTWQNKQLPNVHASHNNHKRDACKECCTH